MLGHYARSMHRVDRRVERNSLILTAALAATETSARLGRYLPIKVDSRHWRGAAASPFSRASIETDAGRETAHWTQWPAEAVSRVPAAEALAMLDAASGSEMSARALEVDLIDRPVELNAGSAAMRILCRLGGEMLSVIAVCAEDDPWAQACDAVAELFAEIFHELLTDPTTAAGQARGLGPSSRQMVLGELAGEAHDDGPWRAIPRMIEENVARYPDRPAYAFEGRTLTFREFDGLCNAYARQLASRGVSKGAIVPVLLANSLEMPVAYQALMKLGAAFVPLDHAWPAQRLQQALDVLASEAIVCAQADDLPEAYRRCAVPIEIDALAPQSLGPRIDVGPGDAIYGIFTSGTTGNAKCALNLHGGLANRFHFMSRYFNRDAGERRILQNSRHTFDSSVWQLFWPLTLGAQVVIPRQGAFLDLEATIDTIARHRITMTDFVPSVFNQIVALAERDPAEGAKLSTLTELIVGGEEITPPMVHKLRALLPHLRITNAYGPTETSIGMVFHPVEAADGMAIPIGRPIDNCYVVIVDDALRPLPLGASGEILVGGICVGAGYLKQPEVTARAFIDNPFPTIPGSRLYRTGDLGYFDSRGKLRFVGRKDFQVKVGGVRIELGEVEAAAERCPQVHHAKALVAAHAGAKSISLFVAGERELDRATLERHLRGVLPRASLPRHYFVLASMPVTDNGKVDRRKLQAQLDDYLAQQAEANARTAPSADESVTGRVLAVLRKLLAQPQLEADADFFAAGGDSLQALAATMELERLFSVRLPIHDFLAHASAANTGARIESLLSGNEGGETDETLIERDARYVHAARAELFGSAPRAFRESPALSTSYAPPRSVLLTGGTGFVGSYLAKALLDRCGDLDVHVLLRAEGDAQRALVDVFERKRLWNDRYAQRLHAIKGDLATPELGLCPADYDKLASRCDAILHCGALVNFVYDYRAHRAANVLATQSLIRLSCAERVKPFFFISTLGALEAQAQRHGAPLDEAFDVELAARPKSGYSRSKWVAERMLLQARREGAPVTVFRLGEVMPAADEGIPNARALTHFLLSAFAWLGARPSTAIHSDWSPVDYVAQRIVSAMFAPDAWNRAYHVFHPRSVCFASALEQAGIELETLGCEQWLAALDERIARGGPRELRYLRNLLPRENRGEAATAAAMTNVLTNNPALFSRAQCEALEREQALADIDLAESIGAYGRHLAQSL